MVLMSISPRSISTAAHEVPHEGHREVVDALIGHGADVNLAQAGGGTPLIRASHAGHLEIINALIEHGADVNAASQDGATPLMAACVSGDGRTAELLLSKGADPRAKVLGRSAQSVAMEFGHTQVAELIGAALNRSKRRSREGEAGT